MNNPFFHIDFAVVPPGKLARMPHRISSFEAKRNGQVLWGKDIRHHLPEVTLGNLDYGNTKHLVLIRLTEMLLYIPRRIVSRCASQYEERVLSYVQARNALDILTVLLPHEGHLLPTYQARNRCLETTYASMPSAPHMGEAFPDLMSESLHSKLTLEFESRPVDLYQKVLESYAGLLRFFLKKGSSETWIELCDAIEMSNLDLTDRGFLTRQRFHEWRLRFKALRSRQSMVGAHFLRKRLIAILLLLHLSLMLHLQGDPNAWFMLKEARERLEPISQPSVAAVRTTFAKEWLGLRQRYFDLFTTFYVGKRGQRPYYRQVLEWQSGE
jgi:hypothetical protein